MSNTHSIDLESSSSQHLTAADSASLSITGNLSIEAWVKVESTPGDYTIVSKRTSTGNQRSYSFEYADVGAGVLKLLLSLSTDGTTMVQKGVTKTLTVGSWIHVAVAYTASSGTAYFYVDGAQEGSQQTGYPTSIADTTSLFAIGALFAPAQSFFDGLVDDVRVWNTARTAAEIADNRFQQLIGNESGLAAYWKLNNALTDSTANANTLTNVNTAVFSTDNPHTHLVTVSDTSSMADSVSVAKAVATSVSSSMGMVDSVTAIRGVVIATNDYVGISDSVSSSETWTDQLESVPGNWANTSRN